MKNSNYNVFVDFEIPLWTLIASQGKAKDEVLRP